jgi:hypothetical protein
MLVVQPVDLGCVLFQEATEAKGRPEKVRKRPPVWQLIKHNIYTHRARKQQDEDDIMICQCPRLWGPPDPSVTGCGPNCLNRMLNIECVTVSGLGKGQPESSVRMRHQSSKAKERVTNSIQSGVRANTLHTSLGW